MKLNFFKKEEKPLTHQEKQMAIKQSYLIKITLLEDKYPFLLTMNKLMQVVRDFFREYYHINYEFTFDELIKELEKTKMPDDLKELTKTLVNKLRDLRYSSQSTKLTEQDILRLTIEVKFIIRNIHPEKVEVKKE